MPKHDSIRAIASKLGSALSNELLLPGDSGYDEARRLWNQLFDHRPEAIARCTSTREVVSVVRAASEHDLPIAVKSGGHSYAGVSVPDGGLLIDLSAMNEVRVDPEARLLHAQPAATWRTIDEATTAHGLATTGCTVSGVALGGYVLGGGTGYLARSHGLCLDNLRAAEVVTSSGEVVRASSDENPELFWAIRGGSGNFGVVTSLELQLHQIPPSVTAGQIVYPFDQAEEVLAVYRSMMAEAPDELSCLAFMLKVPPMEAYPENLHGTTAVFLIVAYIGSSDDADDALRPLDSLGDPVVRMLAPMPYTAMQQMFDGGLSAGRRCYSRAHFLSEITDEVIDKVLAFCRDMPGELTSAYFEPMGGAVSRIPHDATAYPHRDSKYGFHIFPGWENPDRDAEMIEWASSFHESLSASATGGAYVNLLSHDEESPAHKAYQQNLEKLSAVKRDWDPRNVFRFNHNILPRKGGVN